MVGWISYLIFGLIVGGSFIAIGLKIYRRILEIKRFKKEKVLNEKEKESVK